MKKINKLNNKGFTLIELLAVVVILAVVMGIAMTSVISSMNKARRGSLDDSAAIVMKAFNQSYTESLVDGVPDDVYGDTLGTGKGYDFSGSYAYYIPEKMANVFDISKNDYALVADSDNKVSAIGSETSATDSFVSFDATTGKFIVCMIAEAKGSYYVKAYASAEAATVGGVKIPAQTMYACSNGDHSWK